MEVQIEELLGIWYFPQHKETIHVNSKISFEHVFNEGKSLLPCKSLLYEMYWNQGKECSLNNTYEQQKQNMQHYRSEVNYCVMWPIHDKTYSPHAATTLRLKLQSIVKIHHGVFLATFQGRRCSNDTVSAIQETNAEINLLIFAIIWAMTLLVCTIRLSTFFSSKFHN